MLSPATKQAAPDMPPFKVRGALTRPEDLIASSVDVFGQLKVSGTVTAGRLKVSGECRIAGHCLAEQVDSFGSLRVHSLEAEHVRSSGYLSAEEVTAVTFLAKGAVELNRLTASESVIIRLSARSRINQLKTEGSLTVSSILPGLSFFTKPFYRLNCRLLEGHSLHIEHTTAERVCGNRIIIGPGCQIEEVRYTESLHIDKASTVNKITKINVQEEHRNE
ncbi:MULTISPECIES: hypothetical protein [unclassified Paenibacillus]|uniref:hypothetical protein n=1 Tax=unclassified Paenibacillus TaxID=185978 RepID=UPI002404D737|nr:MULTISPECIES: hypothetical protein [unclassified Paenibacillus]MDF9842086.1 cytoskeletal protein CcmA (bactofilin family) [Paenibacillus sp. PastF-2]MDF9848660.1 cytoskeletal protein CcmA (bactofilin family) [Paenibacillus sp. PastM-2]MDF9855229.1 cytoskeletal protein CcmA (bactofilin family) [Paenibacillus sp. PastF-1]MDH6480500.1 cytoskeletal protein CcmA (bactofilin family) [Paenibacillus sp. PastH-2]MDH6507927.1 cytoskeletal protein CcmA (bactofilin family) [Paenibacillus sp. PastM-3]